MIADLSKAFSIAGVRTGWMIEHDAQRRQQYWTARAYFSICNTTTGEILSEIAIRKRDVVLGKTQEVATRNLKLLERFMLSLPKCTPNRILRPESWIAGVNRRLHQLPWGNPVDRG